MEVMFLTVYDT